MYGNGALIGMAVIRLQHQQITQDLRAAPTVCYGAVVSATSRIPCRWVTASASAHIVRSQHSVEF
jgi:hypothetical protein